MNLLQFAIVEKLAHVLGGNARFSGVSPLKSKKNNAP